MSPFPQFNWQRFWVPRTGTIDLSDGGFLVDPTNLYSRPFEGKPLTQLSEYRVLVLLGEPGIGKSTTLRGEADRLRATATVGLKSIHADLRAYSSEILLHKRIFENPDFLTWVNDNSHLVLQLDSLDEALLRIDSIANLLADELPRYPTGRLSLRIACRTAVWPSATLEPALENIWGNSAVGIFELAPLCRRDVVEAAEISGLDADSFIHELYSANVVPFAIKPLTLNLLLDLFKKDGRLPRSVADIYFRGCLALCEEQSPSRRDARRLGAYTAAQRLRIASRIAAATMFANRYAVWIGPEGEGFPGEDISLRAIAGSNEQGGFPSFTITEASIREALDTGLFTSRGSNRMGWAHQGYAEFLAASYLHAKEVSLANELKLVLHQSGGLIPQLATVGAWMASISTDVRTQLMKIEPFTLLQGDLSSWDDSELGELTDALLIALDKNLSSDFWLVSALYTKLNHTGLPARLRRYIRDSSKSVPCRRTAMLIAEQCGLQELKHDLLDLALDSAEDAHLRGRAISALSSCGGETVARELIPVARRELGEDPDDEMRGYALALLWPDHLNANDLFSLLTRPREGFAGSYVMFLTNTLPNRLTPDDLPFALRWAISLGSERNNIGEFHLRSLADSIFVRAWEESHAPEIADPLMEYVLGRLRAHYELFGGSGRSQSDAFYEKMAADPSRRRKFLLRAAQILVSDIDAYHLMRSRLLQTSDLQWLLDLSPGGHSHDQQLVAQSLISFIRQIANLEDQGDLSAVYTAALKWDSLWQTYRGVFEGIPIASEDAIRLRRYREQLLELEAKRRPPIAPVPKQLVAEQLASFEAGDWNAWWRLNLSLTLSPTSNTYGSDFDYSIVKMPGWLDADDSTRRRILDAASRYLRIAETSISKWIGKNPFTPQRNDLAAIRAMLLLRKIDESAYREIPSSAWAKWAPVVVTVFNLGEAKVEFLKETLIDALAAAPGEFVGAVRKIMRGARQRTGKQANNEPQVETSFFILRLLEGCWHSDALKKGLFAELKNRRNTSGQFAAILDALLAAQFMPARKLAVRRLRNPRDPQLAQAIAISLVAHEPGDAWETIWNLITEGRSFGQSFFLDAAQRARFDTPLFVGLKEDQLAEIYVYLERNFPRREEREPVGAHFVGPREKLAHFRDAILRQIVGLGTVSAVSAMRWIIGQLPELTWLSFHLLEAQRLMRMKTWTPLSPKELFDLIALNTRTLVQSTEDLAELLVSALQRYQEQLHGEQNPVRALWDRQAGGKTFRPVEEDAFTDNVRLFLKRELAESGIVVNREVEIGRVPGAPIGTRTDIRVDATRRLNDGSYDSITAVIESKGCWNRALFSALKDQLYDDYMVRLRAPYGIYLVAWFDKLKWDRADQKRKDTPNLWPPEIQSRLEAEASGLPQGYAVTPIVIACHAPA
jgi:hypothetical protein